MSLWHANANLPALSTGANVTVFSPHRMVRVITADQLSIEVPGGSRLSAQVLDRTGDRIKLVLADGSTAGLTMTADDGFASNGIDTMFSRQSWTVN